MADGLDCGFADGLVGQFLQHFAICPMGHLAERLAYRLSERLARHLLDMLASL